MKTKRKQNHCKECNKKVAFECVCGYALCKKHILYHGKCPKCEEKNKKYEKARNEGRICSAENCNRTCDKDDKCFNCRRLYCADHRHDITLHKKIFSSEKMFLEKCLVCDECWEKMIPIKHYEERLLVRSHADDLILVEELL